MNLEELIIEKVMEKELPTIRKKLKAELENLDYAALAKKIHDQFVASIENIPEDYWDERVWDLDLRPLFKHMNKQLKETFDSEGDK